MHITHTLKLMFQRKKTENVRLYALKVQKLVEKGCCNESAETINLK